MGKKKSAKPLLPTAPAPEPAPPASATTTYSTRFDPQQRELIEEAARLLNWSPAKLIRDAAVRRAADVVNAAGPSETKLRSLANVLLRHLFNPQVEVKTLDDERDPSTPSVRVIARNEALLRANDIDYPMMSYRDVWDIEPLRPHDAELAQVRRALETGGTKFLEILLQQWDGWARGDTEYQPKVSAEELLRGGENE